MRLVYLALAFEEEDMIVAEQMRGYTQSSSWIRKMFEEGARLMAMHGAENVYDFSLGNPDIAPPKEAIESIRRLAGEMSHGYMPNAGYPEVRQTVAAFAAREYEVSLAPEHIIMTCGAGGGLNVVLRSILNPGDEVIALAPYFVEYGFYVENYGGKLVVARCNEQFFPAFERIEAAITPRTKAIIINTPNNPTGRVYPEAVLAGLRTLLAGHPNILLISDEPYRRIVYDDRIVPSVLKIVPRSVVVTSASKDLSLAGERIGYIAIGPGVEDKEELANALILANRILGFVNAPALMQRVLAECIHLSVDVGIYQRRRDLFRTILDDTGLSYAPPEGTFYLFVKAPIADDIAFSNALVQERILSVPGAGFGYPGYVRFAYCTKESVIEAAAPGLKKVVKAY
jgi:aspartate aminotransferase